MPTYDYRCPNGHDFEHFFRKISDAAAELECPVCGAVAARRVSGGAGLLFKGSGFYLTDYGKNAHRKGGGGADTSGSGSGGDSSASGGDSAKSDPSSATTAKSDGGSSASKSDGAKTTDSKPSGKTKGSDSK